MKFLSIDQIEPMLAPPVRHRWHAIRSNAYSAPQLARSIRVEGKDALTIFDLARFFRAYAFARGEVFVWIEERGPFSEAEEPHLFNCYLAGIGGSPSDAIWFEPDDQLVFAEVFALCLLFRWDFWLIDSSFTLMARHSHDTGVAIFRGSHEMIAAVSELCIDAEPQ
ncbi:hypothetical protein ASA1KI_12130 [Opitutales bacterium ASA1]|uniref:hypothetical protein n=1 Tax=Congregicoccus parvus TaxID=3081749 RepID=UPI002B2A7885|nr:hypothetical protein ASA1KI_12130 [Opitutales bacterium ASA1]